MPNDSFHAINKEAMATDSQDQHKDLWSNSPFDYVP